MGSNAHVPVLLGPVLKGLNIKKEGCYVDATFGRGGHSRAILERLDAIALSGDLEEQRRHFVSLNEHLIALAQKLDLSESPLYVQHCPMANQNKGALWLSDNKEIRNPYYGDAMLTCGSVMDSIQ